MPGPDAELVARLRAAGCVFAEEEARLLMAAAPAPDERERLVSRRIAGEPLETLLGWVDFAGLRIAVGPGVFVPRRRTGLVARLAADLAGGVVGRKGAATVLDLCCGAGAIGAAVLRAVPAADVYAADIDPVAVRWARRNLPPGRVFAGDLFSPLPSELRGRVDVLAVNAPYVPTGEISLMPPEARDHEPEVALDGGPDGLKLHRRIAREAAEWLAPGGTVLIEASETQAPVSAALFAERGFDAAVETDEDLSATVVRARLPA